MDFRSMIEALRLKQKTVAPRVEPTYYAVVRYNPHLKEWDVNRYDEDSIEMAHERYIHQGAARYIARTWMDMYNVTRVYVYQMDGKLKDVLMQGDKGAAK